MFLKNKTMKYSKKGELPFNSGVDKAFYPWLKIQKPLKKMASSPPKKGIPTPW